MLWIFKSQLISDVIDVFVDIEDFVFGYINCFIVYVFLSRFSGFPFDKVAKIIN